MNKELKPCPFCGGKAELKKDGAYDQSWNYMSYACVECTNCHVTIESHKGDCQDTTEQEAVSKWNRRV